MSGIERTALLVEALAAAHTVATAFGPVLCGVQALIGLLAARLGASVSPGVSRSSVSSETRPPTHPFAEIAGKSGDVGWAEGGLLVGREVAATVHRRVPDHVVGACGPAS
jgi:hypothetical protein